ncbi:MAG: lysophospholipid acyltransferase family protein [Polyangiaceae bacterium]|nr:lysophospholipid acyltransferase family protein [Polyangiaceae bacterium]
MGALWLRVTAALVALWPRAVALAWGRVLGFIAGSVLRIRRRHVDEAMRIAGVHGAAAPRMYRNLGYSLAELFWFAGRRRDVAEHAVFREGDEAKLRALLAEGPVVFAGAHTGNWELASFRLAQEAPLAVLAKAQHWAAGNGFIDGLRASYGVQVLRSLDAAAAAVRGGRSVVLVTDQVPARTRDGDLVPFLGRPARVDRSPAALAARLRKPLVVVAARREGPRQIVHVLAVLEPRGAAGVVAATREATRLLGAFVLSHPESWMWLHRRWKDAPAPAHAGSSLVVSQASR